MGRDIVAELRSHAQVTAWNPFAPLCAAAAAEVEALRAEVARLTAERDAVVGMLIVGPDEYGDYYIDDMNMDVDVGPFSERRRAVAAVRRAAGLEEEAPR
jgi:hypothetical protein